MINYQFYYNLKRFIILLILILFFSNLITFLNILLKQLKHFFLNIQDSNFFVFTIPKGDEDWM